MPPKKIHKNGMTISWSIKGDRIFFELESPKQGWLAIGFNPKDQLSQTNLIMGAVDEQSVRIDDRYILAPGNHQAIIDLGGTDWIADRWGRADAHGSQVGFSLPLNQSDNYHYALKEGASFHMLIAYSLEDDFMHHSIMRSSVKVEL